MATKNQKTSVAALSVTLNASAGEVQLLPDGVFRATDGSGRPDDAPCWRLNADVAKRLIARMSAKPNPLVIDYEHQTLNAEKNGQPAPAAGWFAGTSLEYREGGGLFAINPAWTKRAAAHIDADEYKFASTVFEYDLASGDVLDIRMAALTNNPGLTGMAAVALTAINDSNHQEALMPELLKKLLAALGLPETATEDEVVGAVESMKKKAGEAEAKTAEVAALTAKVGGNPDPSKFVGVAVMEQLQTQVAALTAQVGGDKVDKIVADAVAVGKLLPAQVDWAKDLGKSNLAALTGYIEKTPVITALGGTQTGGADPAGTGGTGVAALTAAELGVCKNTGVSPEDFLKTKTAAA
ncbi:MAG: phage protease [Azonexus sp.]